LCIVAVELRSHCVMSIRTVEAGVLVTVIEAATAAFVIRHRDAHRRTRRSAFIERGWREGLRSRRWACRALEK